MFYLYYKIFLNIIFMHDALDTIVAKTLGQDMIVILDKLANRFPAPVNFRS